MIRDRWIVAALGVAGLLLGIPYALSAGFVYDDWALVSHQILGIPNTGLYVGSGLQISLIVEGALFRTNAHLYYVTAATVFSLAVMGVFVALRALRVDTISALIASALLLAFPAADSLRLWYTATMTAMLAVLLATLGIAAGSRWVERRGRSLAWLVASFLLWAGAVLCYFSVVVLMVLPLALISFSPDRRKTLLNLAMNLAVGVLCLTLILPTSLTAQYHANWTLGAYPGRVWSLWTAGFEFLVVGPVSQVTVLTLVLCVGAGLLTMIALGVLGRVRQSPVGPPPTYIGRQLTAACFLLIGALASWSPLIPASPYYSPSSLGIGNRVNGFAQIFLLAAVGLLVTTLARVVGRLSRHPSVAAAITAGLAVLLLAVTLPQTVTHADGYTDAATIRSDILTTVGKLAPTAKAGTTVLLGDYDEYDTQNWIPVFASTWDFNGAVQTMYHDATLSGYPVLSGFTCTPTGLRGLPNTQAIVPFDRLIVIDVGRRRVVDLTNRTCTVLLPGLLARPYPS
ncbi:MAG: hypothetical protein WCB51_02565 [Candidatus Dormiibacterota bacterium]